MLRPLTGMLAWREQILAELYSDKTRVLPEPSRGNRMYFLFTMSDNPQLSSESCETVVLDEQGSKSGEASLK